MGERLPETNLQKMCPPWVLRCTCGFAVSFSMSREGLLREHCLSDHYLSAAEHRMENVSMRDYLNETGRL